MRQSAAPRSFLRQLAEPIPRAAAPLIPRRPATERGAATRSSLDAIPQIIDVTETQDSGASEPQHAQSASSIARRVPQRRTKTSIRFEGSQVESTTSTPAVHTQPAKQPSASAAETILQSAMREHARTQTKSPSSANQEDAHLQSVLAHPVSTQAASPLSPTPPQTTAKTEQRRGVSVHIGTIEVRVPPPPPRTPQPAPAAPDPRNAKNAASGRTSEPLSRGLAWSHGLVQG
jgi:hypothetical protein